MKRTYDDTIADRPSTYQTAYSTVTFDLTDDDMFPPANAWRTSSSSSSSSSSVIVDLSDSQPDDEITLKRIDRLDYSQPFSVDMTCILSSGSNLNKNEVIDIDTYQIPSSSSSSSSFSNYYGNDEVIITKERSPLNEILDMFPDASDTYIKAVLLKHGGASTAVPAIIQDFVDKGYEKKPKVKAPEKLNYDSTSWTTSEAYRENALIQLQNDFPFLKLDSIKSNFQKNQYHYTPTLASIEKQLSCKAHRYITYNRGANNRIVKQLTSTELNDISVLANSAGLKLKKYVPKPATPLINNCSIFSDEMTIIDDLRMKHQAEIDKDLAAKQKDLLAEEQGALIECECCCSDYAFENLVQCSEGHLFCKTCLQRYAEQSLFGNGRTELKCMNTHDNCKGHFSEYMMRLSLPEKVYVKFQEALSRDAIKAAKLENLITCHECQLQVQMPEEAGILMRCPSCANHTCRLCGDEGHVPFRCEEVEKKGETDHRITVEEAMTKARVRECKKCKTRFYKTEGCNKMTCACGAKMCYICRADINKEQYNHFCQTPHCSHKQCKKCALFTDSVEDDRRAMLEAGLKTLGSSSATATGGETKVDINKLLETVPSTAPQVAQHAAMYAQRLAAAAQQNALRQAILNANQAAVLAVRTRKQHAGRGRRR